MEQENYMSTYIRDFLEFLEETENAQRDAEDLLVEANRELCDLEHFLEFEPCGGTQLARAAKRIREARRKRRRAKETLELCQPIMEWLKENKQSVKALQASKTLGRIEAAEHRQETRRYCIQSDILSDMTDKTHL